MHTVEHLLIAAANQLELWTKGIICDEVRRDYLIELIADLRDYTTATGNTSPPTSQRSI